MTALPPPAGPSSPLLQIWQSQGPAAAAARAIDDGHLVLHGSQGASLLAVDGPPLPGRPGPASGYLNVNRLITTADEMRQAFDLVSGLAET